jgi:hypothetical protein
MIENVTNIPRPIAMKNPDNAQLIPQIGIKREHIRKYGNPKVYRLGGIQCRPANREIGMEIRNNEMANHIICQTGIPAMWYF